MKKKTKKIIAFFLTSAMVLGSLQSAFAGTYVVKEGDWLSTIAPKYNTTWQKLAELNNLKNPDLIYPNQVLQLPELEVKAPEAPAEKPAEAPKAEEAVLTDLSITTMVSKGITPLFAPDVKEYSFTVQSDIYGVLLNLAAPEGTDITVTAAITPGAYGETDKAEPLVIEKGEKGYVIPLTQTYEGYDSEFVQTVTIDVVKGESKNTYTVTITRECASDVYALFDQLEYTDEAGTTIAYNLYVPTTYDESKEYPVVLVLHGGGQRTQPTDMILKRYQMATVWAKDSEAGINECIVVAPHMHDSWYGMEVIDGSNYPLSEFSAEGAAAYSLLQNIKATYSVDESKIYATGASMGGMGSLTFGYLHPEEFAAIMPCCARQFVNEDVDYSKFAPLSGRILYGHAEDDPTCPYAGGKIIMENLKEAGIEFETRIYPSGSFFYPTAHFSWVPLYNDRTAREWLFSKSR